MEVYVGIVLMLIYVGYISLGGVAFHYLEAENEKQDAKEISKFSDKWLENRSCISQKEFRDFLERIIEAYENGIITKRGEPLENDDESWSMHKSVYFATTIVTTIGYGNIAPVTTGGRIVCVIFAVIGIPFALVVYGYIGSRLDKLLERMLRRCFKDRTSKKAKIIRSLVNIVGGVTAFILLPSIGFARNEDWSYAVGCYYSFITLTTIGLGDYVAGFEDKQKKYYHLLVSLWIVVGLAWMSSLISNIYDIFNTKFSHVKQKIENNSNEKGKDDATDAEKNTRQNKDVENGRINDKFVTSESVNPDDSCTVDAVNNKRKEEMNVTESERL